MMLQHLKARLATAVICPIVLISTSAFAQSLPAGWSTSDIGDVARRAARAAAAARSPEHAQARISGLTDPLGLSACEPQCFAQLKYRPTDSTRTMNHALWYVQGSDGQEKC